MTELEIGGTVDVVMKVEVDTGTATDEVVVKVEEPEVTTEVVGEVEKEVDALVAENIISAGFYQP